MTIQEDKCTIENQTDNANYAHPIEWGGELYGERWDRAVSRGSSAY